MKRIVLTLAMVAIALGIAGCASEPLELTATDSGTTQSLAPDQELTVTLEANPTTGYAWAIDGELPEVLEQSGEPEFTAESDLVGAGGAEIWRFRATSAGEGELKLKYWRSFEPTVAPIEEFSVIVKVK